MSNQVEIDAILAEAESALSASAGEGIDGSSPSPGGATAVDVAPPPEAASGRTTDVSRILELEVPVIVRLAHRKMRVKAIMQFATGSIIEFDKPADGELDLMINNEVVGYGQAVKVGENFGLRVLRVLSLEEKIEALGPDNLHD